MKGLLVLAAVLVRIWRVALGEDIRRVAGRGKGIAASPCEYPGAQVMCVAGRRRAEW